MYASSTRRSVFALPHVLRDDRRPAALIGVLPRGSLSCHPLSRKTSKQRTRTLLRMLCQTMTDDIQ